MEDTQQNVNMYLTACPNNSKVFQKRKDCKEEMHRKRQEEHDNNANPKLTKNPYDTNRQPAQSTAGMPATASTLLAAPDPAKNERPACQTT